MGTLIQNFRFGFRVLAKNPGFTAAAVLCLALGIGATTAIFSVVNAVVLRPLPYAQSARLVRVFTEFPTFPNGGLRHFWLSPPEYFDLKRDIQIVRTDLKGWVNSGVNLAGASEPVRAQAVFVTGGLLLDAGRAADDGPSARRRRMTTAQRAADRRAFLWPVAAGASAATPAFWAAISA